MHRLCNMEKPGADVGPTPNTKSTSIPDHSEHPGINAHAEQWNVWRRHFFQASFIMIFFSVTTTMASANDPWTKIGLQKPAAIEAGVDRRLRLLAVLPEIDTKVKTRTTAYFDNQGPGLAVGLVLDDGLYYSKGFGWQDATKQNRPDESTLFWVGSLTKVFTGTALLTMVDTPSYGMTLDDDLVKKHWADELSTVFRYHNHPATHENGNERSGKTTNQTTSTDSYLRCGSPKRLHRTLEQM